MPSYRTILTIGLMHEGRHPREVEEAARRITHLESFDIVVVAAQPRVTARFTAADDDEAMQVHQRIVRAVADVAQTPRARLAKVVRGRSVGLV